MAENAVSLDKQMAAEREYYLGKTDKIPGSDQTVAEAKKAYRAGVDKENKRVLGLRNELLAAQDTGVYTTTVTEGVTVDVKRSAAREAEVNMFGVAAGEQVVFGHNRESLGKLSKAALAVIGEEERSHIFPETMGKDNMIALILGEKFDSEASVKAPSSSKSETGSDVASGSTTTNVPNTASAADPSAGTSPGTGTNPTPSTGLGDTN